MPVIAFIAAASFAASMGLLVAFEQTKRSWLGWAESYAFLVLYVSLGMLVVGLHGQFVDASPALVWACTIIGGVGAVVALVAQLMTMFLGVPFTRVAALVTAAFGGVILWMGGISAAGLIGGVIPDGLGWLGVVMVIVAIAVLGIMARDPALIRADRMPTPGELLAALTPFMAIVVWLVWLGLES